MNKKLSIIIVSYNSKDVLADCLNSVFEYNDLGDNLEVIVIEQSEKDDVYNWLISEYQHVKAIRRENRGFGAGNNMGFKKSSGEYLLFLNPDTVLIEPIGEFACRKFSENETLGLFGVRLTDKEGNLNNSFLIKIPYGFKNRVKAVVNNKISFFNEKNMYIVGADMFVRRSAFEKAGMFDDNFFMFSEEADLCNRIQIAGYSVKYFKEKTIKHLEGKSSAVDDGRKFCMMLDSFRYYCEKFNCNYIGILKAEKRLQFWKKIAGKLFMNNRLISEAELELKVLNEKL